MQGDGVIFTVLGVDELESIALPIKVVPFGGDCLTASASSEVAEGKCLLQSALHVQGASDTLQHFS